MGLIMEPIQKRNQLFCICGQGMFNILWQLGVCNKQFKHVERVELHLFTVIPKQIHPNFQIRFGTYVAHHYVKMFWNGQGAAHHLCCMSTNNILVGLQQAVEGREEFFIPLLEKFSRYSGVQRH